MPFLVWPMPCILAGINSPTFGRAEKRLTLPAWSFPPKKKVTQTNM